jgi:DnaJ-class molecular chaperone
MRDPYQCLGVSRDASDEEIKKAYREMAKKYHPDNYANTEFADIAGEKMKEINEAYDRILEERAGKTSSSSYGSSSQSSGEFARIRTLISSGRINEAEVILDGMADRGAQWHYLKGMCEMYRRNYHAAASFFQVAYQKEPGNPEYAAMYQRFQGAQHNYGTFGPGGQTRECDTCDICTGLMCADCMCECLGGDLIGCC